MRPELRRRVKDALEGVAVPDLPLEAIRAGARRPGPAPPRRAPAPRGRTALAAILAFASVVALATPAAGRGAVVVADAASGGPR